MHAARSRTRSHQTSRSCECVVSLIVASTDRMSAPRTGQHGGRASLASCSTSHAIPCRKRCWTVRARASLVGTCAALLRVSRAGGGEAGGRTAAHLRKSRDLCSWKRAKSVPSHRHPTHTQAHKDTTTQTRNAKLPSSPFLIRFTEPAPLWHTGQSSSSNTAAAHRPCSTESGRGLIPCLA